MKTQSTGTKYISRLSRGAMSLALALLVGASFGAQAAEAQDADTEQSQMEALKGDGSVELQVSNFNWQDVRVYALRGGQKYRLGTVTGLTSDVLRIPKEFQDDVQGVQLLAVPIGSRDARVSPVVHVLEGDRLIWRLENNLALSSLVRTS